ncbi:MAG: hypothetical protein AAF585_00170 [Verrucomicrobiota bacterium]
MRWNARRCPAPARQLLGLQALRLSLVVIYVWFGALKLVDMSPACELVLATAEMAPVFDTTTWLCLMGWGEIVIGLLFIFPQTIRLAVICLAGHMVATSLPMFFLPELSFQSGHYYAPTLTGQYIIKNLMIISAGLVIGGALEVKRRSSKV